MNSSWMQLNSTFIKYIPKKIVDQTFFFKNPISNSDATKFKSHLKQDFFNEIFLWTCHDECNYHCMWRTTNIFVAREWSVPQFYGKWPFKRILGIQEPASVFFSFLNLMAHWRMIRKFRREVRSDSPMYYVWHALSAVSDFLAAFQHFFFFYFNSIKMLLVLWHWYFNFCFIFVFCFQICINAWICSIIFHTRDFPLTELLDYGFAYSMVLANFCCMILR